MEHHFNGKVAEHVGVAAAIILQSLFPKIQQNKSVGSHKRDGYYWVDIRCIDLAKEMPYFHEKKISRHLLALEGANIIKSASNYNRHPYDKTKWYTIIDQNIEKLLEEQYVTENKSHTDK